MRLHAALGATLLCLLATIAQASEESERLYSRGLIDFHAGRYPDALRLFELAVAADPADVYAHYYRGVTHGRLGNYDAAVNDLRAVLRARPALDQAALELGVALVHTGAYAEALPLLERGQQLADSEAAASLFLGIAYLRLQQRETARVQWSRALARDPALAVAVQYYQGIAAYQDAQWERATQHFEAVVATSPSSAMGREAAAWLQRLRAGERPATEFFGEVGLQYDSNVVLAPNDDALATAAGISRQSDGRAVVSVGGRGALWRGEQTQLTLGYEFYQSRHFHLTDFDLQNHRASAQLVRAVGDARAGLLTAYDFDLLDTTRFLHAVTAFPWMEIPIGTAGRTEVSYRLRWRDFRQEPFESQNSAFNHAPAIREILPLGAVDRYLLFGYQYDRNAPVHSAGDQYGYDGHELLAGVGWGFPQQTTGDLLFEYRHEDYDSASNGRADNEYDISVLLTHPFGVHASVRLGYFGTINDSNDANFSYTRHIASVSVQVRF